MKYSIIIGIDCVSIFINGSLDYACAKDHSVCRFVEHMRFLESMGYKLDSVEYKSDYVLYD